VFEYLKLFWAKIYNPHAEWHTVVVGGMIFNVIIFNYSFVDVFFYPFLVSASPVLSLLQLF